MKPEAALRVSSLILAATGLLSLALTGEMPVGLLLVGVIALLVSAARLVQSSDASSGRDILDWPREIWNSLLLVAFAGFVVDLLWITQDLLPAGIHFLILLMAVKLFTLRERKDFVHLYAMSLLAVLAAAALTVELWYAAIFVVFLFGTVWTLLLLHLRSEAETAQADRTAAAPTSAGTQPMPGPLTTRFFWTTNAIAVGAFCLTLVIFFLTPRLGAGFFNKNKTDRIKTSGFSEQVDLGGIGSVKLDPTVVMRVELPDQQGPFPATERLYFRGMAYDHYDGRAWANRLARRHVAGRTAEGLFVLTANGGAPDPESGLRQEILIEALDTSVLFGATVPVAVKGAFSVVQEDGMGAISLPFQPIARFQYTAYSRPEAIAESDRTAFRATYPDDVRERYLQTPELDPRIAALAAEVTKPARTPLERVVALEAHLRNGYAYALDVGDEAADNPLAAFLFVRKSGYCEHYATAMAMMLRTLGIPARLATGFLPGEWNDFGRYYTVRQRDAHAWVEVYFPQSGWVTFDPTPAVPAPAANPLWASLGRMVDSVKLKWDRLIIRYSFRDQMKVAEGVKQQTERAREHAAGLLAELARRLAEAKRWGSGLAGIPLVTILLGLGFVGLLLTAIVRVARLRLTPRRTIGYASGRQADVVRVYTQMVRVLEHRGIVKQPGATAHELAAIVSTQWGEAARLVEPLTDLYCRVRFGHAPLSPDERRQAEAWLSALKAMPR